MTKTRKSKIRTLLSFIFSFVFVLTGGIHFGEWRARAENKEFQEVVFNEAKEIATAINPYLANKLTFTASDTLLPEYIIIEKQINAYQQLSETFNIKILALRNGHIVFGPGTYRTGDQLSPIPGKIYQQAPKELFEIYSDRKPGIIEPSGDISFPLSGLAPVTDPSSGKTIMMVCVDIPQDLYFKAIKKVKFLPLLVTITTLLLIVSGYYMFNRKKKSNTAKKEKLRYAESNMIAITGIFLTVVLSIITRETELRNEKTLFKLHNEPYISNIQSILNNVREDLFSLQQYFSSSEYVTGNEFKTFVQPLVLNFSDISFIWAPCVLSQNKKAFENSQQQMGARDFKIYSDEQIYNDPILSSQYCFYPIQYSEPALKGKFKPGFDLNSVASYRSIIQESQKNWQKGFINTEPVNKNGSRQNIFLAFNKVTKNQGSQQDSGFVIAAFSLESILNKAISNNFIDKPEVAIDIIDLMGDSGMKIIASSEKIVNYDTIISTGFYKNHPHCELTPLFYFGRAIAIVSHSNDAFLTQHRNHNWWITTVIMLLLTSFITIMIRFLQNRQLMLNTLIRQKTSELEISKHKAEESDRLKSALLLNLSHELRTPLNGILGFGEILTDQLKDPEQKKMFGQIMLLGQRLMTTFTSMLKLSQLEAEKSLPVFNVCDLEKITKSQIAKFKRQAALKKITIKENIDSDVFFRTDMVMFSDILFFLIDNAIKFTNAGYIWIDLHQTSDNGMHHISVSIRDTGIGISDEQLRFIFDPFRQGSEGIGRSHDGNGMGLSLCNRFISLLGGELSVESIVNGGSTFTISFVAKEDSELIKEVLAMKEKSGKIPEKTEQNSILAEKKLNVLIVEDNQANAELLVHYLENYFVTDISTSGKLALKYAWQNDYDIILMDINLGSEMDGIQTTKEIRALKNYTSTPIIAVTGYSTDTEKNQILEQGLNDFISKPFTRDELLLVINKWVTLPE